MTSIFHKIKGKMKFYPLCTLLALFIFSTPRASAQTDLEKIKNCIGFYKVLGDVAYDNKDNAKAGAAYNIMLAYRRVADRMGGGGRYKDYEDKFTEYVKSSKIDEIRTARAICSEMTNSHPMVNQELNKISKK